LFEHTVSICRRLVGCSVLCARSLATAEAYADTEDASHTVCERFPRTESSACGGPTYFCGQKTVLGLSWAKRVRARRDPIEKSAGHVCPRPRLRSSCSFSRDVVTVMGRQVATLLRQRTRPTNRYLRQQRPHNSSRIDAPSVNAAACLAQSCTQHRRHRHHFGCSRRGVRLHSVFGGRRPRPTYFLGRAAPELGKVRRKHR
jgi:hypothetical protein